MLHVETNGFEKYGRRIPTTEALAGVVGSRKIYAKSSLL